MSQRMTPDKRRNALIAVAAEAFAGTGGAGDGGGSPRPGVRGGAGDGEVPRPGDPTRVAVAHIAALAGVSEPLVYRYFPTKAALHAAVVERWASAQAERIAEAVSAVPEGAPVRDRVQALLEVLLDDAARGELWWVDPSGFPAESLAVVAAARTGHADVLRHLLPPTWYRREVALEGWPGFIQSAVRAWAARGCPDEQRWHVVDATLGALQGALGDWGA